jgi:hypothetical protein
MSEHSIRQTISSEAHTLSGLGGGLIDCTRLMMRPCGARDDTREISNEPILRVDDRRADAAVKVGNRHIIQQGRLDAGLPKEEQRACAAPTSPIEIVRPARSLTPK